MNLEITKRVIDVVARTHQINPSTINQSKSLQALGIDSFEAISLFYALEEEFDITLPETAKTYRYINDIILDVEALIKDQHVLAS